MARKKLISCSLILLITGTYLVGCTGNNTIPLPGSAKHDSPNGNSLDANQITIPFPYTDKYSSGEESWFLDRDSSNHLVLDVVWKNRKVATFPLFGIGVNTVNGEIALGDDNYNVLSITLNSDELPTGSGWVTLQKQ